MKEPPVDDWMRERISANMRPPAGDCVDASRMAAYREGTLSTQESAVVEAHLAACSSCQEMLALILKMPDSDLAVPAALPDVPKSEQKPRVSLSLPIPVWGGIAAVLLLAGIFLLLPESQDPIPTQTAELRAPDSVKDMAGSAPAPDSKPLIQAPPEGPQSGAPSGAEEAGGRVPLESPVKGEFAAPGFPPLPAEAAAGAMFDEREHVTAAVPPEGTRPMELPSPEMEKNPAVASSRLSARRMQDFAAGDALRAKSSADGVRSIGDKEFVLDDGVWIDRQCLVNAGASVMDAAAADAETQSILKQYPELRAMKPVRIYWKGSIYTLR